MTDGPPGNRESSALSDGTPLLTVTDLVKRFPVQRGVLRGAREHVHAVDGVGFHVLPGETLSLVGESGCGKTTTARVILGLEEAERGSVLFRSRVLAPPDRDFVELDLTRATRSQMKAVRREIQMIFQDPFSSLNPRMTAGGIVAEPLLVHGILKRDAVRARVLELFRSVGLDGDHLRQYPHQFSGGQRQRIGIARALALNPRLVIADEPVSALDVSVQAQVLNLLKDLQAQRGLTYILIAHDLAVVRHVSDRVAVMYLGKLVELADVDELFLHPRHPYTQALISAVPAPDPSRRARPLALVGAVPDSVTPPSGCRFHPRCPHARTECSEEAPELREITPGHTVACHFAETLDPAEG